jgi:hypothetical protein
MSRSVVYDKDTSRDLQRRRQVAPNPYGIARGRRQHYRHLKVITTGEAEYPGRYCTDRQSNSLMDAWRNLLVVKVDTDHNMLERVGCYSIESFELKIEV